MSTLLERLEAIVDAEGLPRVVAALADMCHAKADHVFTTWQDKTLSRLWTRRAVALDKATPEQTDTDPQPRPFGVEHVPGEPNKFKVNWNTPPADAALKVIDGKEDEKP